jgi:glutaredoxin 3
VLELYGSASCPYTAQLREELRWQRKAFVEYDVDGDPDAFARLVGLCEGDRTIPVLIDDERVVQVGYEGRGCYAAPQR